MKRRGSPKKQTTSESTGQTADSHRLDVAFQEIGKLVHAFAENEHHYKSGQYSEAGARKDFIDKFWIALGWDVNHEFQTNPYEQEVKVEKNVSTAGSQRRADYAFYLTPNFHDVKFFVEAKKPSVDIGNAQNYFQLIRYGWNSQNPLAALTDFEQFHVLDCRYRPDIETALHRAVGKYHYSEYTDPEKFAEIYWLFSREAVADGSIEKRAKELPKPRGKAVQRGLFPGGYQSIDETFLAQLDQFRDELARSLKLRNPELNGEALTEISQRVLDRLVFLRFLEDKGIEAERRVENFGDKGTAWEDFIAASHRLDVIYNGVVYKRHDILDSGKLVVDDNVFAHICEDLAHVNSPYDFNAIPIHILGSIYERFLGKVITASAKRAKVEEKPEVRKAGGVYYTPEYIVRYIVENTVGKLIEGKSPAQIAKMRFADISCGSGSFLLGVFDCLLAYHGHYYNQNPDKARKGDCTNIDGRLHLTLQKKREILLNNIYGVDIDAQAVEVCQLSLYLKLLQEETEASTRQYSLDFLHTSKLKKLLPDLSKNIVCGNSLIGTDILEGQLFPRDEERKLNPMNFEDAFPEVMNRGGFDAIVGNPPYLFITELDNTQKKYYFSQFETSEYRFDIYGLFIEQSVSRLLRDGGMLSFIIPHTILSNNSFTKLRRLLLTATSLIEVIDIGPGVFAGAKNETMVFVTRKGRQPKATDLTRAVCTTARTFPIPHNEFSVSQDVWLQNPGASWLVHVSEAESSIVKKMESAQSRLGVLCTINQGLRTGNNQRYLATTAQGPEWKPAVGGKEVGRYEPLQQDLFVFYDPRVLDAPRSRDIFESLYKIVVQEIRNITLSRRIIATYDHHQFFCLQSTNVINIRQGVRFPSIKYILGVLNSNCDNFFFRQRFPGNNHIASNQLAQIPIPIPDNVKHDAMVAKVEAILDARQQMSQAQTEKDRTYFGSKCASLDRQIDRLVYDLYGLTEEEIAIVEDTGEEK